MRCPSCGTENEADSRFCGGCGARLAPSRLAPTQKIADSQPPQIVEGAQPSGRVVPRTPLVSTPPPVQPMAPSVNRPPRVSGSGGNAQPIAPVSSRTPAVSASLPPPPSRTRLVVAVLLLDVALAVAGGWMLYQGLTAAPATPAAPAPAAPTTAPTPTGKTGILQGSVPTSPAASALPTAVMPATAPVTAPVVPPAAPARATAPARAPGVRNKPARAKRGPVSAPLDPYGDPPPPERPN